MPYVERPHEPAIFYELDDYTDPWKKAPCLLLQHGFARSSRFWYSWVPYLSRFYRVVRPDLRGLGNSSRQFDFNTGLGLNIYLDDINAIIDHLNVDSVHYCGESLGGILGMAFAAEFPARVRTLSLISAPVYVSEHNQQNTTYGYSSRIEALRQMGAQGWAEASNAGRRFPPDADRGLKQVEDPRVLVGPRIGPGESMILDRIRGERPVLLSQLDQPLLESHDVLELDIRVDHAVQHNEWILEALGEEDR